MGAHKQRWTAEEETALKAGVVKHGMGKWRTILTDPEFSSLLRLRSNVDLKDKWRNINVTANGWGSRHRARIAIKKSPTTPKRDDNLALSTVPGSVEEVVDAKPLAVSRGTPRAAGSKEPNKRLDSLILEALTSLKEPGGSDKHAIAMYIEEQYWAPHNLKKLLSTKLKHMSANGKLIKLKRKYRIAPNSTASEVRSTSSLLPLEGRKKKKSLKAEKSCSTGNPAKSQIDVELSKSRCMSALEAAEAAARAVAEAEVAIAEAEEAARVAEAAEAEAEAAQIFAEAAMKALKCRTVQA